MPIAYGALDVRGLADFGDPAGILVAPTVPGEAMCLVGAGAALWRRLIDESPLSPTSMRDDELAIVEALAEHGLAAFAETHPARVTFLSAPVLSSPLHELVYALTARVAADIAVPCVFVKGPPLHLQGLREREHSGDVDVWCEPSRWTALATALESWGWERLPDPWHGSAVPHSMTMSPRVWGCEIDVHRRLPGLALDDAAAFAVVCERATTLRLAGVDVLVPAIDDHAVLAAVNAVRPGIGDSGRSDEAAAVARALLRAAPGSARRAHALGAVPVLRDEIARIEPAALRDEEGASLPRDWTWRSRPDRARAYLTALRMIPRAARLPTALRVLWPPDDVALASARAAGEPLDDPARARRRRLVRGLRQWWNGTRRRNRRTEPPI